MMDQYNSGMSNSFSKGLEKTQAEKLGSLLSENTENGTIGRIIISSYSEWAAMTIYSFNRLGAKDISILETSLLNLRITLSDILLKATQNNPHSTDKEH